MGSRSLLCFAIILTTISGQGCGSSGGATPAVGGNRQARLLLGEDFNTGGYGPLWNDPSIKLEYYGSTQSPFVSMPGHGFVFHQFIPKDVDDVTPAQIAVVGSDGFRAVAGSEEVEEFYIEWEEFFPEDHDFANAAQKLLRFVFNNSERGTLSQVNLQILNNNNSLQLSFAYPGSDFSESVDIAAYGPPMPQGRWVHLAVWCKLNSKNNKDGFGRVFLDGVQVIGMEDLNNRGNDPVGWNIMWIGGNHTNHGPTTQSSSRFIDNIKWFDTSPN